jgi:hypothetical protein
MMKFSQEQAVQILADLKEIREVLVDPMAWTQGAYCRDAEGELVEEAQACCYCLDGAIWKVLGGFGDMDEDKTSESERHNLIVEAMFPDGHSGSAIRFNDDSIRTHAEVLAKIDEGIARMEALV